MMTMNALMSAVASRPCPSLGEDTRMTVVAALRAFETQTPRFSVTCDIEQRTPGGRWGEFGGGAMHDEIRVVFPELSDVIKLHLADENGEPMYAVENGLYWLGLTRYAEVRDVAIAARLWRTDVPTMTAIESSIHKLVNEHGKTPTEALSSIADAHRSRWAREADAAKLVIQKGIPK